MKKIKLTKGKYTMIDDRDKDLRELKWFAHFDGNNWYAKRNIRKDNGERSVISMHQQIKGKPIGNREIDHVDGNGLNNKRDNLRFVTHRQNMLNKKIYSNNSSGFTGVSFHKASGKWRAYARGKTCILIDIGIFERKSEAVKAYKKFKEENYQI